MFDLGGDKVVQLQPEHANPTARIFTLDDRFCMPMDGVTVSLMDLMTTLRASPQINTELDPSIPLKQEQTDKKDEMITNDFMRIVQAIAEELQYATDSDPAHFNHLDLFLRTRAMSEMLTDIHTGVRARECAQHEASNTVAPIVLDATAAAAATAAATATAAAALQLEPTALSDTPLVVDMDRSEDETRNTGADVVPSEPSTATLLETCVDHAESDEPVPAMSKRPTQLLLFIDHTGEDGDKHNTPPPTPMYDDDYVAQWLKTREQ